jgi:hypothetical protein
LSQRLAARVRRKYKNRFRNRPPSLQEWIPLDLTAAAGSSLVASSDPSAYTRSDGLSSVVFRAGTDVHELFKGPGGVWVLGTPSALASAPGAAGRPFGYTRSDGSNTIVYVSTAGHIIELLLTGSTWSFGDLSQISGNTSTAIGNPTAYVRLDGVESVVFRTSAA